MRVDRWNAAAMRGQTTKIPTHPPTHTQPFTIVGGGRVGEALVAMGVNYVSLDELIG